MLKSNAPAPVAQGFVFPQRSDFERAVDTLPTTLPRWAGEEGPRFRLEFSPGSKRITSTDFAKKNRTENEAIARHLRKDADMLLAELDAANKPKRGQVKAWSLKSQARMALRLATIDYSPLFADGRTPAMTTVTMPHDWTTVAPTAQAFKKIVNRFRARYEHAWGHPMTGVWKMEFQWRKDCAAKGCHDPAAPHLHIIMTPPLGTAYAPRSLDDLDHVAECSACEHPSHAQQYEYAEWLSRSWAASVGHPDPIERRKNERAGTGVDYVELENYSDPKRIGVYFSKHGLYSDKSYQNVLPQLWRDADSGGAHFWGYWVLRPMIVSKEIHEALIMYIMSTTRTAAPSPSR